MYVTGGNTDYICKTGEYPLIYENDKGYIHVLEKSEDSTVTLRDHNEVVAVRRILYTAVIYSS